MVVRNTLTNEKGQILIFIALAFIVLGLLAGLAVDAGRAYLIQARLSKIVDAAAIAGARAMPGATSLSAAVTAATAAACDSAEINGIAAAECGASGPKVFVTVDEVTNPDGDTQQGVIVRAVDPMATSFMKLGTLIGCGAVCSNITVAAAGQAAPDSLVDVVLVLDTTGSMNFGCGGGEANCPIAQLRKGAKALVDCLIGTDCGLTSSNAKIGLVPFRACYGSSPCVPLSQIVNLTNNNGTLTSGINALTAAGYTNVCTGINKGREILFGAGSRAMARKAMVVLTDGANHFGGSNPGGVCSISSGSNSAIYDLDVATHDLSTDIKRGLNVGSSGQNPEQTVEIYVLRYAGPDPPYESTSVDTLPSGDPPGTCSRGLVNDRSLGDRNDNDNDERDRNLSRCIASNNSTGGTPGGPDPFSTAPNDHYFWAANPGAIQTGLDAIAQELLKKLRLVN